MPLVLFCQHCRQWHTPLPHHGCTAPDKVGTLWLHRPTLVLCCNGCQYRWQPGVEHYTCPMGHRVAVQFTLGSLVYEANDQRLGYYQGLWFVLRASGLLVIAQPEQPDLAESRGKWRADQSGGSWLDDFLSDLVNWLPDPFR